MTSRPESFSSENTRQVCETPLTHIVPSDGIGTEGLDALS
jgi:hypothetical protein